MNREQHDTMMDRSAEKLAEVERTAQFNFEQYQDAARLLCEAERKLEIAMDALKVSAIMPRSHEAHRRAVQALAQIGGNDAG